MYNLLLSININIGYKIMNQRTGCEIPDTDCNIWIRIWGIQIESNFIPKKGDTVNVGTFLLSKDLKRIDLYEKSNELHVDLSRPIKAMEIQFTEATDSDIIYNIIVSDANFKN